MHLNRVKTLKSGEALIQQGRLVDAERLYQEAIRNKPKDVKLLAALARLLMRHMNREAHAEQVIRHALKVDKADPDILREAAELSFRKNNLEDAKGYARASLVRGGGDPDTLYVAATIFEKLDDFDTAVKCLNKALEKRADHLPSRILYAKSIRSMGRLDEAAEICRDILRTHPDSLAAMAVYVEAVRLKADDPHIATLKETVIPALREQSQSTQLQLALGLLAKARLDAGEHEKGFLLFKEAKEVISSTHDRGRHGTFVKEIKERVTIADFFGRTAHPETRPVLIVGMPRVGSTLLEQIIAGHPETAAVGESGALRSIARFLGAPKEDGAALAKVIKSVPDDKLDSARQIYLGNTADKRPGALRVIDKNLHNFQFLGLFARMFPKARIIHARRDPMDNCVACYLQRLSSWHSYTDDLASLGQYYREHIDLMAHWKTILPNPILDVHYEDMVDSSEATARKVIGFLGLEWNDACLRFQETENRAKTFSAWQVRQPIYQSSVRRWKRYEQFLEPLKKELEALYPNGIGD